MGGLDQTFMWQTEKVGGKSERERKNKDREVHNTTRAPKLLDHLPPWRTPFYLLQRSRHLGRCLLSDWQHHLGSERWQAFIHDKRTGETVGEKEKAYGRKLTCVSVAFSREKARGGEDEEEDGMMKTS